MSNLKQTISEIRTDFDIPDEMNSSEKGNMVIKKLQSLNTPITEFSPEKIKSNVVQSEKLTITSENSSEERVNRFMESKKPKNLMNKYEEAERLIKERIRNKREA